MKRLFILCLNLLGLSTVVRVGVAEGAEASTVTLTVSDRVTDQLLSGAGASWHSILHPPVSQGGSAFGGSPPVVPQHERLWASMGRYRENTKRTSIV